MKNSCVPSVASGKAERVIIRGHLCCVADNHIRFIRSIRCLLHQHLFAVHDVQALRGLSHTATL